jgi:hypothetical protein
MQKSTIFCVESAICFSQKKNFPKKWAPTIKNKKTVFVSDAGRLTAVVSWHFYPSWGRSVPPPAQPGSRARPTLDFQDGLDGASQQEATPLFLPQLNQLHELSFVRGKDASNVVPIPTQHRVTQQILSRWYLFKDLKQTFVVSRRAEQLRVHVQQRVITTVEDSV